MELQVLCRETGSLCFPLTMLLPRAGRAAGPQGNGGDTSKQAGFGQAGTPETRWSQLQRRGAQGGLWNVPPLPVEVKWSYGV